MNENRNIIILEQLPIIKTHLEELSLEIQKKVDNALNLVCTEDTVKDIKQLRATLNKEFSELETQRKQVKNAIMEKYDAFEEIYKENVSNLYKKADGELKIKIENTEKQLKENKIDELELYAKQHIEFNNLETLISFDDINLNVTLSASMKSLKEQILKFINKVKDDVECISSDENRDELLYEYLHNGFDYSKAVLQIKRKKEELEKIKKTQDGIQLKINEDSEIVESVEEIITKPEEIILDEEMLEIEFKVKGTKQQLVKLREFMKEEGIIYE